MDKQMMLDKVVEILGHEHEHTIWFAQLIEEGVSEDSLWTAFILVLDYKRLMGLEEG